VSEMIPKSWIDLPVGDIANVVAGGTPKAGDPDNFAVPGSDVAWLTPADLSKYKGKFISHGARDLSQAGYDSSSAKLIPKGGLLFSSRAPIGYVVIAENPICTNQGFKNFVFTEQVDSNYAFYYLKSIRDLAESLGSGTTFKELSGATAKTIPFRLAPLAEQKVIADKLDELLAQVESTKARLDAIPTILKYFRQSVLAAAVSGKLTEEWREDNRYEITQKMIQSAFKKGWETEKLRDFSLKGKEPKTDLWKAKCPLPYLPTEEDQALFDDVPQGWEFVSVDELTRFVKDGPHFSPKYSEKGVPFISGRNISVNGVDFSSAKYISKELHADLSRRCKPEVGDILLTKGGTTGIACVNTYDIDFNVWVHVAVLRVTDDSLIHPEYLSLALNSPDVYSQSQAYTHGVANRDLGLKRMIKICFPIPHVEEQTEIVRRVEELLAFADKVETQINAAQARVNNLTLSILAKAFRGELTADWRAANPELISGDNSAEALLKKIKAEREKLKPVKKRRLRN